MKNDIDEKLDTIMSYILWIAKEGRKLEIKITKIKENPNPKPNSLKTLDKYMKQLNELRVRNNRLKKDLDKLFK